MADEVLGTGFSGITYGRRKIYSDYTEVTPENIVSIIGETLTDHLANALEIKFLHRYEKGEQAILTREKNIRSDINNRVVENNASVASKFLLGYRYGQPITYVQKGKYDTDTYVDPELSNSDEDEQAVSILNEYMFEQDKASKDLEMMKNAIDNGTGFRLVLPNKRFDQTKNGDRSPFELITLNPATTYVVYANDVHEEPILGVSYTVTKNGGYRFGAYSKDTFYYLEKRSEKNKSTGKTEEVTSLLKHEPHIMGEVPIIEYINDHERMGAWERAIPVLDALNLATSDRLNSIAQHVQSLLWIHNAEINESDKGNLDGGIIMTHNSDGLQANIKYMEAPLDQSATQSLQDYLYDQFLMITGIPGRESTGGGSTGTAMLLQNGWQMAETNAMISDIVFDESEKRMLRVILNICQKRKGIPKQVKNVRISDIEIHHGRKKDYELVSKSTALATLLNIGVDGNSAFSVVNLFPDSQQVWNDSKETVNAMQRKLAGLDQGDSEQSDEYDAILNEVASSYGDASSGQIGQDQTPSDQKSNSLNNVMEQNKAESRSQNRPPNDYSEKTTQAIVAGIMSAVKPIRDRIDGVLNELGNEE